MIRALVLLVMVGLTPCGQPRERDLAHARTEAAGLLGESTISVVCESRGTRFYCLDTSGYEAWCPVDATEPCTTPPTCLSAWGCWYTP